jgi:hypothetical protein
MKTKIISFLFDKTALRLILNLGLKSGLKYERGLKRKYVSTASIALNYIKCAVSQYSHLMFVYLRYRKY